MKEQQLYIHNIYDEWWKLTDTYTMEDGKKITINHAEVILLIMLDGYEKINGKCYAGNDLLGKRLNVKPDTITKYIRDLKKVGLIRTYDETINEKTKRRVYVQEKRIKELIALASTDTLHSSDSDLMNVKVGVDECQGEGLTNVRQGVDECQAYNYIDTNINNNNDSNTYSLDECKPISFCNDNQEEVDLSDIPDVMMDIVKTCRLQNKDIRQCYQIAIDVCETNEITLDDISRFWTNTAKSNNTSCVTTTKEFSAMILKVIVQLMKKRQIKE